MFQGLHHHKSLITRTHRNVALLSPQTTSRIWAYVFVHVELGTQTDLVQARLMLLGKQSSL